MGCNEVWRREMTQHQRPFHVHVHHLAIARKVLARTLIWQLARGHRLKRVGGPNSSVVHLIKINLTGK